MEQKAGRIQSTGIGTELVFKDEANRQAVAEIFRTLEAEAGAGLHAAFHGKLINGVMASEIGVSTQILDTRINDTVELNISSESRTGKSAENGNCSKSLFHFDLFL